MKYINETEAKNLRDNERSMFKAVCVVAAVFAAVFAVLSGVATRSFICGIVVGISAGVAILATTKLGIEKGIRKGISVEDGYLDMNEKMAWGCRFGFIAGLFIALVCVGILSIIFRLLGLVE